MTLVLSCLANDFVLQASDRRVVSFSGELQEDTRNKAVVYCGHTAFAFTGLAEIDGTRTDLWLADQLGQHATLNESFEAIAKRASQVFRDVELPPRKKRHAFVGVGWAKMRSSPRIRPMLSIISNFINLDGAQSGEARDKFLVYTRLLPPREGYFLFDAGQSLSQSERGLLRRRTRRATAKRRGPLPIAEYFVEQIRAVASRSSSVGEDILLNVIPREAAGRPDLVLAPEPGSVTFMYVPADHEEPVWYGPTYKCQGITMTAFEARSDRPPEPPKWLP